MEKTRFGKMTSLLLVFVFLLAPLKLLRATDGVEVVVSVDYGSVVITSITNTTDKRVVGWTVTIKGIPETATIQKINGGQNVWNATASLSGGVLTFKSSESWNSVVEPYSTTTISAGCYLDGISELWSASSVSVKPVFEEVNDTPTPDPKKDTPTPDPKKDTPTPEPKKDTPTPVPTTAPTSAPTSAPTAAPSSAPTAAPTAVPTSTPETVPTAEPTAVPGTIETTVTPAESSESSETTEPSESTSEPGAGTVSPSSGDDWLTTDGNKIVDSNGTQVWLTGINWFGYNTGTNIFDGCWNVNMDEALKAIADHGFNLLRIPMSAELALSWKNGIYPEANFNQSTNSELVGKNSQEIFDYALSLCQKYGLKVMLDIHSANTDASGHMTNLWYTDKVSLEDYYDALSYLADRYKDNDTVIAFDLKNEPHGKPNEEKAIWNDSASDNNWKYVAEEAGRRVLDVNPNLLIVIEGIEIYPKDLASNGDFSSTNDADYYFNWWGGNLRGVKDYPIDLGSEERNKQIVYSPHDYGPAVYAQPWFEGDYTYESLKTDCWNDNWLYIYNENTAPILIGEWGGYMTEPNLTWMTYLRQLIAENHLNFTFWCFNSNSGDTGGLVLDDFKTWDDEKYEFVKEVLWQDEDKFVGLDHAVPLGDNGISLSEYSGVIVSVDPVVPSTEATTTAATEAPADPAEPSESETAAAVTPAVAAAAAAKSGVSVGKIVGYGFLFLLLLFLGVCLYLYIKRPKDWNRLIDRFYLPEKLKRDIPWELDPEIASTGRFTWKEEEPKNNEFAGKYRPAARPAETEPVKKAVTGGAVVATATKTAAPKAPSASATADTVKSETSSAAKSEAPATFKGATPSAATRKATPASPRGVTPAAHRGVTPAALSKSASGAAKNPVKDGAEVAEKKPDQEIPSILRDVMNQETPAQPEETKIIPTWASGSDIPNDRPIWAKPVKPDTEDGDMNGEE